MAERGTRQQPEVFADVSSRDYECTPIVGIENEPDRLKEIGRIVANTLVAMGTRASRYGS